MKLLVNLGRKEKNLLFNMESFRNFLLKIRLNKRKASLDICDDTSLLTDEYNYGDSPCTLLGFECRGVESEKCDIIPHYF